MLSWCDQALVDQLQSQGATVFAMDCIPRMLSRGQAFDALSSQANIAGYRAVVEAAHHFPSFFAGQMTAAGKVKPAQVNEASWIVTRGSVICETELVMCV